MTRKILYICLAISLVFSAFSYIYYIADFNDATFTVLGTIIMLNLFIIAELGKAKSASAASVKLWKAYFSVIASAFICEIKIIKQSIQPIWLAGGTILVLILVLVVLHFIRNKKEMQSGTQHTNPL